MALNQLIRSNSMKMIKQYRNSFLKLESSFDICKRNAGNYISVNESPEFPSPISTGVQFDTAKLVKNLREGGISQAHSEVLVNSFSDIMKSNAETLNMHIVTKAQQEIMSQHIMSHVSSLKKDMIVLERSEFAALKHEYEKQGLRIMQLERMLNDQVERIKNGMLLDINMERARSVDAHSKSEKSLLRLGNRLDIEQSKNDKNFSVMEKKIEKESANLLAIYERYKNDVLKYSAGAMISGFTVLLGFMRIWV